MWKFETFINSVAAGQFPSLSDNNGYVTWLEEVAREEKANIPSALIEIKNTASYLLLFEKTQELLKKVTDEDEKKFFLYLKKTRIAFNVVTEKN